MEEKTLICIGCPLGCQLCATLTDGEVTAVSGNTCPTGAKYAKKELTAPERTVTTTLRVSGGNRPVVSVRTAVPIGKAQVNACIAALRTVTVPAPVAIGQVLLADVEGSAIVATSAVSKQA